MKYQFILWDFDGTIADTLAIALGVYNRLADERGFVRVEDPEAVRNMGMRDFLASHNVGLHHVPLAFAAFLKEIRERIPSVRLMQGVQDALEKISALGLSQGIVSSNQTDVIRSCLQQNQVDHYFEQVIGTSRIFGKEHRLKRVTRKLKMEASAVLYVGDEIRDIEAAQGAGLDVAAVTWGLNASDALSRHNPTYLVHTPQQLLNVVAGDGPE